MNDPYMTVTVTGNFSTFSLSRALEDMGKESRVIDEQGTIIKISTYQLGVSLKEILESTPLLNAVSRININEDETLKEPQKVSNRLKSLDIFRGLTMVGMILVDNQGNGNN
jgi:hypothetical protein